jgi:hypothetical protein
MNPFAAVFPEVCNVNDLALNTAPVNFVAIKVGDVNNTAATTNLGPDSEERNNADFGIRVNDSRVKAGETFTVDFTASLAEMLGYQFTLRFDPAALRFEKFAPAAATSIENYGLGRLDEGVVTASWYQMAAAKNAKDEVQFSMTFTALKNADLSQLLRINNDYTIAESYDKNGTVRPVALEFINGKGSATNHFELYQNIPNPFTGETVIRFQLPEASPATLIIFNMEGKAVKTVSGEFGKGFHEVMIDGGSLPANGLFYYRLETPGNTATLKMTLLH